MYYKINKACMQFTATLGWPDLQARSDFCYKNLAWFLIILILDSYTPRTVTRKTSRNIITNIFMPRSQYSSTHHIKFLWKKWIY